MTCLSAEAQFSLFSRLSSKFDQIDGTTQSYFIALLSGAWVGLSVYSARSKLELRRETKSRVAAEQGLELQKIIDPVTGLVNRSGFEIVLDDQVRSLGSDVLMIVGVEVSNLDTIKGVHGPESAERIEVALARHLTGVEASADFVARGDKTKFYLCVTDTDVETCRFRADQLIENICQFARKGIDLKSMTLQIYVNFGIYDSDVSDSNAPVHTARAILQRVDFALHSTLNLGSESVVRFDAELESSLHKRAFVESSLGEALKAGQIVPYFQPFVDLETDQVTGFEILARWDHPTKGQILPTDFISVAEEIGALKAITISILQQACELAQDWPQHIKLAINVSPTDLHDDTLISHMIAILRKTGFDPHRLEVEVTENAFVEESGAITENVEKLKSTGISISVDDFGTGYSSLHHLRVLPFDKIKIDQSFIKDMATNPDSKSIVEAVIALGKTLGLPTTAEGIEVAQNHELLKELGCAIGQGYLFARPLPHTAVAGFLADQRPLKVLDANAA